VQIGAQTATGLHIQAPVDGFVAHPHQLVIAVVASQHISDQLGAPPIVHPILDRRTQRMAAQLEYLGPARFLGRKGVGHQSVIVPTGKTVTLILPPDHRAIPPDAVRDLGEAEARVAATHDLHAFFKTDPMSPTSWPRQIPSTGQPAHTVSTAA
jgi:hypothetical protein